jgi:hypothetical protein
MNRPAETWNEEAAYDERIFPLMAQVIAICKERRIPMFASFAYGNDDTETHLCTTLLPFVGRRVAEFASAEHLISHGFAAFMITETGGEDTKP